ncbi:hypothetical protein D3C75_1174560 [compost metagenome]
MSFGLTITSLLAGAKPSSAAVDAVYKLIKDQEDSSVNHTVSAVVNVNGLKIAEGYIEEGITYAPVRALAEALGAKVGYNAATKTVEIMTSR